MWPNGFEHWSTLMNRQIMTVLIAATLLGGLLLTGCRQQAAAPPPADPEVAVLDQLPRLGPGVREVHAEYDVIEPALQKLDEVVAGDALHPLGLFEITAELPLQDAVETPDLLLFPQLSRVLRELDPPLAVLPRRIASPDDRAFIRITPLRLQEQLGAFPSAELADRTNIPCHVILLPG